VTWSGPTANQPQGTEGLPKRYLFGDSGGLGRHTAGRRMRRLAD
jgi:hypothetical protein